MAKRKRSVVPLGAALLPCVAPFSLAAAEVAAVPTHEAVGLYAYAPERAADCPARFRARGATEWRAALDLWYDARSRECRGSIVALEPGKEYEAEVRTGGEAPARVTFRTRPDRVPIAKTVRVPQDAKVLHVREGGSPRGYVVYDGGGATRDAAGAHDFNIVIDASYVVVRNFVLRGATRDAIRIENHVTDVVIEDNDIAGWGRKRDNGFGVDMDAAIRAVCKSCPVVERITIQRNRIHEPRYGANSWSDGHPAGPQAIAFSWCGGQHVIRHNEILGPRGHEFNDAIGGEDNFTRTGFPNADTDIYGNVVMGAFDDGIEAEGGSRNVRIWGNYIDSTATGIAVTPTTVGPIYIFRNVYDRSRFRGKAAPDEDERQAFLKAGSDPAQGEGRRYVIHNTVVQGHGAGARMPLGAAAGFSGTGAKQPVTNTWTRNNVFEPWKEGRGPWDVGRGNDLKGDVTRPRYAAGHPGPDFGRDGLYALARNSPGYDEGVRVPNFNDDFRGRAPDAGSHEAGTPPLKFGIAASRGPAAP